MDYVNLTINSDENDGNEAILVEWVKHEQQYVDKDDTIAIVETNKATLEVTSPVSGYIVKLNKDTGETFDSEDILGMIKPTAADNQDIKPGDSIINNVPRQNIISSPAARSLLKQYDIPESNITPNGTNGRISRADVLAYIENINRNQLQFESIPLSNRQQSTAFSISSSIKASPHVTTFFEADLSNIIKHRDKHTNNHLKPTFTAYYVHTIATTLKSFPKLNAHYVNNELRVFKDINIGLGVALDNDDLAVPVIKDAGSSDLETLTSSINSSCELARLDKLKKEDTSGGTFTISNYGVSGSLFATPIVLVQPQIAILGIGNIRYKPVAIKQNDEHIIEVRPMAYISLTIDHRAINGSLANRFMSAYSEQLQNYK